MVYVYISITYKIPEHKICVPPQWQGVQRAMPRECAQLFLCFLICTKILVSFETMILSFNKLTSVADVGW